MLAEMEQIRRATTRESMNAEGCELNQLRRNVGVHVKRIGEEIFLRGDKVVLASGS